MTSYVTTGYSPDPINHPEHVPLDLWYAVHLKLVATCQGCGRSRVIHTSELIKRYGYGGTITKKVMTELGPKIRCANCERRRPELTLEVRKD